VVKSLRLRHHERLKNALRSGDGDDAHKKLGELEYEIELLLIQTERDHVNELLRVGELKDEARRRIERELDLREARIANQRDEN